jgi:predicted DNA-binding transcriptional regulator AlpA
MQDNQSVSASSQSQAQDEILTVSEVAEILRCKPSNIYNLTRRRGQVRYEHRFPVVRTPFGLRFKKSSVLAWLNAQETRGGVQ